MSSIDINFYDRQIRTYGFDAMTKIVSSSVLIYGLEQGLGTEIGKNLTLSGVKDIFLYDNNTITKKDLDTGYYYTNNDLGKIRSIILMNKLKELNSYTTIHSVDNYKQQQQQLNVMIVINQPVETIHEISDYCRSENIKLIIMWSKGISGVIFVDAGNEHLIIDKDMEPIQITNINDAGLVTVTNHEYQTGDIITFTNMEGTNLDFFEKDWSITVTNKNSFQLNDFNISIHNKFIFINGTCNYINQKKYIKHNPFNINVKDNLAKTFIQMFTNDLINQMPPLWTDENMSFLSKNNIILPEQAKLFHHEIIPIVSFLGSIVSFETIKLISNINYPITQWFSWTDESIIPNKKPNDYIESKTTFGLLYGLELETKMINSNWLVVGAGSLGCEYLKNLAFMNVNNITIIDNDTIEKSNLNNHFLFSDKHIGEFKSIVASKTIKEFKPDINIILYNDKVGLENVQLTETILPNITGVINASDNITSRKFMDEECFKYGLPLFDSGICKTSCNIQPIIPFVTDTYSTSNDPEQEKSYPLCVVTSFPNEINHTILWAIDKFKFFNHAPNTMNKWILDQTFINTLEQNEKETALEHIKMFTVDYPTQLKGLSLCVKWAIDMFNDYFYDSINKLLGSFPSDHKVNDSIQYWSNGKKCPKPIIFEHTNKQHLDFIEATVHIIAQCSGISDNFNMDEIFNISDNIKNTYFRPIYNPQRIGIDDWHIKWITATSNLRAMNYNIPITNQFYVKGIVGKIIPSIISTSSLVSGLTSIEMLKYLLGYNQTHNYRSSFINLDETIIIYSEPIKAPMIDVSGIKVNSWTKFEYIKDTSLDEFKQYYEKIFDTTISMIVIDTTMIYVDFLGMDILSKKLSEIIFDHYKYDEIPKNVSFNLLSNDEKELPIISVSIK